MCKRVRQKPPQDHLFEVTLCVITNSINMGNFKAKERCRLSQLRVGFYVYGIFFYTIVLFVFVLFCYYLCCSMYCLCVNVYCHRVTTQLQLINKYI
jgi:hypothetical protein